MAESVADRFADFRSWLKHTDRSIQVPFAEIEDEMIAIHRRILDLEEENLRLKHLLPDGGRNHSIVATMQAMIPRPRVPTPAWNRGHSFGDQPVARLIVPNEPGGPGPSCCSTEDALGKDQESKEGPVGVGPSTDTNRATRHGFRVVIPTAKMPAASECRTGSVFAAWILLRGASREDTDAALHYVAPVGQKSEYIRRAFESVETYLADSKQVAAVHEEWPA
jgi:hypothetical protein